MIFYPAIDLKGGACVRLLRGEMAQATVYNDDPAAQARLFEDAGANWIHVVDLDGAFAGDARNRPAVDSILAAVGKPIQLGGGIRDMAALSGWMEAGISRIVLGTAAVKNPDLVWEACREYPNSIAVGIDAKNGYVAVEGWAEVSQLSALELGKRFEDAGVAAIIYTDIDRDGALTGVNVAATAALARSISIPVIASGGLAGVADLKALKAHESDGIAGVISGRALYDGRLDLREALRVLG